MTYPREQLAKPPLIEAIFEVRAAYRTSQALVPGALYERLKTQFPKADSGTALELGPSMMSQYAVHRFLAADGTKLVQCGPDLFTVNVLGDYGEFPSFARLIGDALSGFYAVAEPTKLRRLAIRYINFLPADAIKAAGGHPLTLTATFPRGVLPEGEETAMRGVFRFPKENGVLGLAGAHPHRLADGRTGCLLDLDFFIEDPPFLAPEDCLSWASVAHDLIYQVFRSSLTTEMYEQLGPIRSKGRG